MAHKNLDIINLATGKQTAQNLGFKLDKLLCGVERRMNNSLIHGSESILEKLRYCDPALIAPD